MGEALAVKVGAPLANVDGLRGLWYSKASNDEEGQVKLAPWHALLIALSALACTPTAPEPAPPKPERPPAPKVEPAPEPEPPINPALLGAVPGAPEGEPTLARFKSVYLAEEAVSTDEALLAELRKLSDPDKAKEVFETIKGREGVVEVLRKALWLRDPNVRSNVAKILVLLEDHSLETSAALIDVVLHDADGDVRSNVARALVTYEDKATVGPLITVLESDPRLTARENAAWALGQIGDKRAVAPLIKSMEDPETRVRLRSVSALKRMKAKEAVRAIVERVQDPNMVVRERAVQALQEITGKKIGEDYGQWKKAVGR